MSIMKAPPKPKKQKSRKKAPKVINRRKQAKRTKKPPKYPGITPPKPLPEFLPKHQEAFKKMEANCYENLHRPRTVKIMGWSDALYYICKECLEEYLSKPGRKKLKEIVVSFGR